jgi:hypothetical protein
MVRFLDNDGDSIFRSVAFQFFDGPIAFAGAISVHDEKTVAVNAEGFAATLMFFDRLPEHGVETTAAEHHRIQVDMQPFL